MVYNSPRRVDNWALLILEDPTFLQNSVFLQNPRPRLLAKLWLLQVWEELL
jgi:hypothetical protein